MQFITFQNFHIQTWFSQFLWFFSLKCWFKGQMISRIHLILPNAYKLMCFDRNINGNRDVKFLECDKWSLHWYKNLTLSDTKCCHLAILYVLPKYLPGPNLHFCFMKNCIHTSLLGSLLPPHQKFGQHIMYCRLTAFCVW